MLELRLTARRCELRTEVPETEPALRQRTEIQTLLRSYALLVEQGDDACSKRSSEAKFVGQRAVGVFHL